MSHSDDLVHLLSRYLARHLSEEDLLTGLRQADTAGLEGGAGDLVTELEDELSAPDPRRGSVEVLVRETLEAIALG
jgi:hypothetical protein